MRQVGIEPNFAAWQAAARALLAAEVPPQDCLWQLRGAAQAELFGAPAALPTDSAATQRAPRQLVALAQEAVHHRDAGRFALLYRLLWRTAHGERHVLDNPLDPDTRALRALVQAVRREVHAAHAFVRFRPLPGGGELPPYVAYYEPYHPVLPLAAPHFVERFHNMVWSIVTPETSAHWDRHTLRFGPGAPRTALPPEDATVALWRAYYGAIFNPARLRVGLMRQHMPPRYWRNLPEAQSIGPLVAAAGARTEAYLQTSRQPAAVPPVTATWESVRQAAQACRLCPWSAQASTTVFGEGPLDATVVLVGEQPGDHEDRQGRPFVGPSGQLLNAALTERGWQREQLYITCAVKHFKWQPRGKRRIHQRPAAGDVAACRPWLEAELARLTPRYLVCLGATAAQAVLGRAVRVEDVRGELMASRLCAHTLVTTHPAAVLRSVDSAAESAAFARLVQDLRRVPYPA